jgi:hypothetical protein
MTTVILTPTETESPGPHLWMQRGTIDSGLIEYVWGSHNRDGSNSGIAIYPEAGCSTERLVEVWAELWERYGDRPYFMFDQTHNKLVMPGDLARMKAQVLQGWRCEVPCRADAVPPGLES